MLEYSEGELISLKFQDITDPKDIFNDESEAKRVSDGVIESYEMIKTYISKTKRTVPVLLRVDGVRHTETNEFLCFVAQCKDLREAAAIVDRSDKPSKAELRTYRIISWLNRNTKWLIWIVAGVAAFIGYVIKAIREA